MGMGEQKRRAKQFEQQSDEALAEGIKQENLFSKTPVECQHTYECIRESEAAPVNAGCPVRLVDMKDRIDVFVGTRPVGHVVTSQTEAMRAQLRLPERKGRAIRGHTVEVSELTPTFTVCVDQ